MKPYIPFLVILGLGIYIGRLQRDRSMPWFQINYYGDKKGKKDEKTKEK